MIQAQTLPDELTIYEAASLHQMIAMALQSPSGLVLDLSNINEIDAAAIQVLIWGQREAQHLERPFALQNPSEAILDYCTFMGLSSWVHFMEVAI